MNNDRVEATLNPNDREMLGLRILPINAQVDALATLAATGGIEGLKQGDLCAALLEIEERLGEVKRLIAWDKVDHSNG